MASDPGGGVNPDANPGFVYLDSNFYLDYLIGGRDWHGALHAIVEAWRRGDLAVATSALSISEVLYLRRDDESPRWRLPPEAEPRVADLFSPVPPRRFILVEVSRMVAERSRELVWDLGVEPKDAIHVASALLVRAPVMFTSDRRLQNKKAGGDPPLRIEHPHWID